MFVVCVKATGLIRAFRRWGQEPFDPATEIGFEVSISPDVDAETWNGDEINPALRLMTQAERDAAQDAENDAQANKLLRQNAINETFLDGHWITLRALAANGITTGVNRVDSAVAANDKEAFIDFFKDQVRNRKNAGSA